MTKEIYYSGLIFVNGKNAGLAAHDDGNNYLLFFSNSLGDGDGSIAELLAWNKLAPRGVNSLHSFNNAYRVPSADLAGIQAVIPGASMLAKGMDGYEAEVASRKGTRGGKPSTVASSAASTVEAAAAAPSIEGAASEVDNSTVDTPAVEAFTLPGVGAAQELANILGIMPALTPAVESWATSLAAALQSGGETPDLPANVSGAATLVPSLAGALDTYKAVITRAVDDYRAAVEAAAAAAARARLAAEAAAAAASNGETLVKLPGGSTVTVRGRVHATFPVVCELVRGGRNVYLHGPAGTGKSIAAAQVAAALDLEYYPISKVDDIYTQLQGAPDVNGNLMETAFYRAAVNGGVVNLDEIDRMNPTALDWLLGALENRCATFPVVGRVDFHPDFVVVATGNTAGMGATAEYQTANVLDPAFRRRFAFVPVGYDAEIDKINCGGDFDLMEFCQAVRAAVEHCGISLTVSPAEIKWLHKFDGSFIPSANLEYNLFKGLEKDQLKQILSRVDRGGRWLEGLKNLAAA